MEYMRSYLINLRRRENDSTGMKISTIMLLIALGGFVVGFLLDFILPHQYFANMLKGVVSVITGSALFSFSYLLSVQISNQKVKKDRFYQTMRERFSHKQRINFSIVIGVITFALLILTNNDGLIYTFKSSLSIAIFISLIAFIRRNRSEFIKDIYEMPDVRDLDSKKRKEKFIDSLKKK